MGAVSTTKADVTKNDYFSQLVRRLNVSSIYMSCLDDQSENICNCTKVFGVSSVKLNILVKANSKSKRAIHDEISTRHTGYTKGRNRDHPASKFLGVLTPGVSKITVRKLKTIKRKQNHRKIFTYHLRIFQTDFGTIN